MDCFIFYPMFWNSLLYAAAVVVAEASLESGVYVIYTAEKNGTERTFVRKAEIATGVEKDRYFEVLSGLTYLDQIVTSDTADLYDGCEVRVEAGTKE